MCGDSDHGDHTGPEKQRCCAFDPIVIRLDELRTFVFMNGVLHKIQIMDPSGQLLTVWVVKGDNMMQFDLGMTEPYPGAKDGDEVQFSGVFFANSTTIHGIVLTNAKVKFCKRAKKPCHDDRKPKKCKCKHGSDMILKVKAQAWC